ncbi:MAG: transposase [Planctomycetaceae bacterium]
MSDYRRCYQPGGTFFFTVVVHRRRPIFSNDAARAQLGTIIRNTQNELPFELVAICLLPDHLHAVWSLPVGDADYSTRWKKIKGNFTSEWLKSGHAESAITASRKKKGERGIWQRRFWEHTINDETDLEKHVDYIHYNPVKHGYVKRPWDWPFSSFRRFVAAQHYPKDWGRSEPSNISGMDLE